MNPAQGVAADIELAGIVAEDDGLGQEAVRLDAAPQRALGGEADRVLDGLQRLTVASGARCVDARRA
jgi:hypothetical protein